MTSRRIWQQCIVINGKVCLKSWITVKSFYSKHNVQQEEQRDVLFVQKWITNRARLSLKKLFKILIPSNWQQFCPRLKGLWRFLMENHTIFKPLRFFITTNYNRQQASGLVLLVKTRINRQRSRSWRPAYGYLRQAAQTNNFNSAWPWHVLLNSCDRKEKHRTLGDSREKWKHIRSNCPTGSDGCEWFNGFIQQPLKPAKQSHHQQQHLL